MTRFFFHPKWFFFVRRNCALSYGRNYGAVCCLCRRIFRSVLERFGQWGIVCCVNYANWWAFEKLAISVFGWPNIIWNVGVLCWLLNTCDESFGVTLYGFCVTKAIRFATLLYTYSITVAIWDVSSCNAVCKRISDILVKQNISYAFSNDITFFYKKYKFRIKQVWGFVIIIRIQVDTTSIKKCGVKETFIR